MEGKIVNYLSDEKALTDKLYEGNDVEFLMQYSPIRGNILEWYELEEDSNVLIIGSDSPVITKLMCQKAGKITLLENDPYQIGIEQENQSAFDNITICDGELSDLEIDHKYDYIVMINSLGKAARLVHSDNPVIDLLTISRSLLSRSGQIIIAEDNAYGIKYVSGVIRPKGLYSRHQIDDMLHKTGYTRWDYYYPMPDYKMCAEIYSDNRLPDIGDMREISATYDQSQVRFYDEVELFEDVCHRGQFPEYANSYLIIGS